jgi:Uma2 family endonuclease
MKIDLLSLAHRAEEAGFKLEWVSGLPLWEAFPSWRHQETVERIRESLPSRRDPKPADGCACIHMPDTHILFPDGSLKRPDVSIFCKEPPDDEKDTAVTLIPEAVIEVVSKGYEAKDLQIAPKFYLMHGVKDVIVHDPDTLLVLHARRDGTQHFVSPTRILLECGCSVVV